MAIAANPFAAWNVSSSGKKQSLFTWKKSLSSRA
jgi:hypothetical protein